MNYNYAIPTVADLDFFQKQAARQLITHAQLVMIEATHDRDDEYYHYVVGLEVSVDIHKALTDGGSLVDNYFSPEPGISIQVFIDHDAKFHTIRPRLRKAQS